MTRLLEEIDRVKITHQNRKDGSKSMRITLPRRAEIIKQLFENATWVIFLRDLETGDIIIRPDGRRVVQIHKEVMK